MKNFFNVNFSVLGLMALLMCAPSLTGCSDDDDESERVMSLTSWCSTDTYDAQRVALTSLTLDGETITSEEVTSYMQGNFATYFPSVTSLKITGKSLEQSRLLQGNSTVETVIGENITSLPASTFENASGVTTCLFPNLETVGGYCFKRSAITELSLPKLKAFGVQLLFAVGVENACFASLTDFTNVSREFSSANTNIAFGATKEFDFDVRTPGNITDSPSTTTIYLNENGYEYQHNVDLTANTWRGVTFKAIKKYSEYPGRKD